MKLSNNPHPQTISLADIRVPHRRQDEALVSIDGKQQFKIKPWVYSRLGRDIGYTVFFTDAGYESLGYSEDALTPDQCKDLIHTLDKEMTAIQPLLHDLGLKIIDKGPIGGAISIKGVLEESGLRKLALLDAICSIV